MRRRGLSKKEKALRKKRAFTRKKKASKKNKMSSPVTTMKPQTISFLDLPPEIRNMIYKYCITDEVDEESPFLYLHHHISRPLIASLNKTTEQEALPMFFTRKQFRLLVHYKSTPSIHPGNQWIAKAIKRGVVFRSLRLYVFLKGDRNVLHVDFAGEEVSCEPVWGEVGEEGQRFLESMRLALEQSIKRKRMKMAGGKEINESRAWAASVERSGALSVLMPRR